MKLKIGDHLKIQHLGGELRTVVVSYIGNWYIEVNGWELQPPSRIRLLPSKGAAPGDRSTIGLMGRRRQWKLIELSEIIRRFHGHPKTLT